MSLPFASVAAAHHARYPHMEPQDFAKLAYQSEFGPAHMLQADPERVLAYLSSEWQNAPTDLSPDQPEDIGSGLCRFPLRPDLWNETAARLLARLFRLTAENCHGRSEGLETKLAVLESLPVPGMEEYLLEYHAMGCPAVHHSAFYNAAYRPHYRLLRSDYAHYFPLLLHIQTLLDEGNPILFAIDGQCGSGKTNLAALLSDLFPCRVFHTDDFYLPIARRSENWQSIPAGNMDLTRLREEILLPARSNREVAYRPFSCQTQTLAESVSVPPAPLTIVEGSYSLHPALVDLYDGSVYLSCSKETQEQRLKAREGDYFSMFQSLWIPLEQQYHRLCPLPADTLEIDTTRFF